MLILSFPGLDRNALCPCRKCWLHEYQFIGWCWKYQCSFFGFLSLVPMVFSYPCHLFGPLVAPRTPTPNQGLSGGHGRISKAWTFYLFLVLENATRIIRSQAPIWKQKRVAKKESSGIWFVGFIQSKLFLFHILGCLIVNLVFVM